MAGKTISDSRAWLRGLPKAELHLHLEGTITPETLVALSKRHDTELINLATARALYAYKDFVHFLNTFKLVTDRLQSPGDYGLVTYEMVKNLAGQGVVHAEVYISFGGILRWRKHLDPYAVMESADRARIEAERDFGVSLLWIVDANRHDGVAAVAEVFRIAADLKERFPSVIGVGIGGNEVAGRCRDFPQPYADAKAAGLRLTAHAGESTGPVDGPIEVRDALDIGAERLGHALEARHDEALIHRLQQLQIPLELNVTSNVRTGCLKNVYEHPLRQYFDAGLVTTINSDDPAMFGSNLLEEYVVVHEQLGFSRDEMRRLARNSILSSFLTPDKKEALNDKLEQYLDLKNITTTI